MKDRMNHAFSGIRAEEQLKKDTLAFLQTKLYRSKGKNHRMGFRQKAVALACLLMLAFTGQAACYAYFTRAMYLDVDINPSVELSVNRFDRVIGAYAYNAEGEELLSQFDLMHKSYHSAVTMLTEAAIEYGFLSNGGLVSVTLQSKDEKGDNVVLEMLQADISRAVQGHHTLVQVDVFSVDRDTREYAYELGLSPAKYLAILELQQADPTATVEGCRDHSIAELRAQTEQHTHGHHGQSGKAAAPDEGGKGEAQDADPADADDHHGHRGNGHHSNRHG